MSDTPETEKTSALEFTPEERAKADTSWVDEDQWLKRDGITRNEDGTTTVNETTDDGS